jgi:hypothetical protein
MSYYLNPINGGLRIASSEGNGIDIQLKWTQAYATAPSNSIGYNIYMSVVAEDMFSYTAPPFQEDFFNMPPAFISLDGYTQCIIQNLEPGQLYRFGVRATEYDHTFFDPHILPLVNELYVYPASLLAVDISATDVIIPLVDAELFPISGVVAIGDEFVYYTDVDYTTNELLVPGGTNGSGAELVNLGGGAYYKASAGNTGTGTINSLVLTNHSAQTETVTIKCVAAQRNNTNQIIAGTADFTVIGSVSGAAGDGYGNAQYWEVDQGVFTSTLLSFSITEDTTFAIGDSFTVKISGAVAGTSSGRGYNGTIATEHLIDGYNGYHYRDPNVTSVLIGSEETNDKVFECWSRFDIRGGSPFLVVDGYRQKTLDILTTDLSVADAANANFPAYSFSGYNRTDPVMVMNGTCLGSYIGGTYGCSNDGYYGGLGPIRGISMQDQSEQRLEVLLSVTGEQCCLLKREWTGITCKCQLPYNEYPQNRCTECYGTGKVVGYTQYFDNRYSNSKIYVRFSPVVDDLVATDAGMESTMAPECWTLSVPTVKDRDVIVRFDQAGNAEYRYEILNVTRNRLFLALEGMQKFALVRIRKTDPIYQIPVFYDTSMFPSSLATSITSAPPALPPHSHNIQISEHIISVAQINQLTDVSYGHNHPVVNGVVQEVLSHSHTIIIPDISYPMELIVPPNNIPQSSS